MNRLRAAVLEYARWTRMLHEDTGRSRARIFARLVACRVAYGAGPEVFDSYDAVQRPLSVVREHLGASERRRLLGAASPAEFRYLEEDKAAFGARCVSAGIPVVPVLAAVHDEAASNDAVPVLRTAAELALFFESIGDADLILKRTHGGRGYGVFSVAVRNGRPTPGSDRWDPEERTSTGALVPAPSYADAAGLSTWLRSLPFEPFSWVLQPRLRAHPDLLPLTPGPGLGTIRVHTFLTAAGHVLLRWPLLKVPGAGSVRDNFRSGRGGSLAAAIDVETGTILGAVGRTAPDRPLRAVAHVPGTDTAVAGARVPCWTELRDVVTRGSRAFPELPALGWDVAVTPTGPVVIEANWKFSSNLPAMALRRGLRSEFLQCMNSLAVPRALQAGEAELAGIPRRN